MNIGAIPAWRRWWHRLLLGGALVFAASSVQSAWDARLIVPFWDEWDFLAAYREVLAGGVSFADLWAPHNGHRLLIPRLLYLARDWALNGQPGVLMLVSQLLQGCSIALVVTAILREPRFSGSALRSVLAATAIVLLTWAVQLENFNWDLQIALVLPVFLAVAAIALVAGWRADGGGWRFVGAACLGVVASLCHGVGLAIWPAVTVVAIAQRSGARAMMPVGIGAAVSVSMYLDAVRTSLSTVGRAAEPLEVAVFMSRLIGPPFALPAQEAVIGALLLALGLAAVGVALWRGAPGRLGHLSVGLVSLGLFASLLIALSRADVGQPGASRYVALSSLYWVGLSAQLGLLATSGGWQLVRWPLYGAIAYGILAFPVLASQRVAAQPFLDRADRSTAAVLSIVAAVPDLEAITADLHPRPRVPIDLQPFLTERAYGFFGDPLVLSIGEPLGSRFAMGPRRCEATLTVSPVAGGGLRLEGRFLEEGGPEWLVVAGRAGRIRGLARRERRGAGIVGYASAQAAGGAVYGVEGLLLCRAATLTGFSHLRANRPIPALRQRR